ncbi:MAG: DUF4007 family protein [Mollicutes bacterium]|nr:DUF4007 family protein [Mollicutes bacterium]
MSDLKFKRNESFYIRDGWFQKAIHCIHNSKDNIFSGTKGIDELGIGSNMVKALKYWLISSGIMLRSSNKSELSEFGKFLFDYDPYLESSFSWFLIHYNLVCNYVEAPIFNMFFNMKIKNKFKKNDIYNALITQLKERGEDVRESYVFDDFNVFLKTYTVEDKDGDPEDNYICPLSSLNLIEKKQKDEYLMKHPRYSDLSYLVVYYSLTQLYKKQFNIEDALVEKNSPIYIFNLDKNMFLEYLGEMKKNNLITINKTAGLNTVYINKKMTLQALFEKRFK